MFEGNVINFFPFFFDQKMNVVELWK